MGDEVGLEEKIDIKTTNVKLKVQPINIGLDETEKGKNVNEIYASKNVDVISRCVGVNTEELISLVNDGADESLESLGLIIDDKCEEQKEKQNMPITEEQLNAKNLKAERSDFCCGSNNQINKIIDHDLHAILQDPNIIEIEDDVDELCAKTNFGTEKVGRVKDDFRCVEQVKVLVIEIDDEDEDEVKKYNRSNMMEAHSPISAYLKLDEPLRTETRDDKLKKVEVKNDCIDEITETGEILNNDKILMDVASSMNSQMQTFEGNLVGTPDEVFYDKECINYECPKTHLQYLRVPHFALSFFKILRKKSRMQFICAECYDKSLNMYEEFCGALTAKQPLLLKEVFNGRPEFVEIVDSSDEDDSNDPKTNAIDYEWFSNRDLDLIENELGNSMKTILAEVEIQNQLTWSNIVLKTRTEKLEKEAKLIDAELLTIQKQSDSMHESLYQCPKIKIRQLQPLDLNSGRPYAANDIEVPKLPPIGEIQRQPIHINEAYYAVKNKAIASWVPCKVIELIDSTMGPQKNIKYYKVKFLKSQYQMLKTVSVKHLAYYNPPSVRLPIAFKDKFAYTPPPGGGNNILHKHEEIQSTQLLLQKIQELKVFCEILHSEVNSLKTEKTLLKNTGHNTTNNLEKNSASQQKHIYETDEEELSLETNGIVKKSNPVKKRKATSSSVCQQSNANTNTGKNDLTVGWADQIIPGTRVIAYFDASSLFRGKEKTNVQSAFYPGIIAEPLKPNNKYRYLIFYDDGYTQYVYHQDVRLVCHVSENVWEDVHPGSRDFIQKYLTQYSINRPMVQTQKGQSMTTESNGKWIYARVVDIDCSLIQMQFEGPKNHTEWIYRGSLRLGPVFKEYQKSLQKDTIPILRLPRRTEPFIRYTADEEVTSTQRIERVSETRAVARKSVSRSELTTNTIHSQTIVPVVKHLNNSTIYLEDENKPKGKVVYYTAKRNLPPLPYIPHSCSTACLFKITHNLSAYSPLSKPLLSGWERLIIRQKIKKVVAYRGPCGKIMRNMKELRNYLRITDNVLNVDNFDFSHETNCLAEYVIESAIVQKRDISGGQEKMCIPLVNYYDSTMPPDCKYSAQRIPTEGVNLNLNEEFLVGCDCEDDCSDKAKCSCWQLTYAGAKYGNPTTPMEEIGYQYKRLYEHVPTGIYECNSRCKCKSNCLNRVVQQSLQMKLQVFKTSNRGWGLRCINDVPRGSFICIYAGHLLTEAKANEGGIDAGDEYFAELDYIEVAEQIKEGYESDVDPIEPEEEEDMYTPEHDDDDEFTPSKSFISRSKNKLQRQTRGSQPPGTEEDSQERQMINFNPNADMNENSVRESSIRQLFGKDEACYVMDAKITGNLGRYFNHSCSPNLFVQNVFVDTHDLRFPWVAFFALTHIRAGTELTWNYNYEVGVVPGKVLYCQCGAPNCRLRLL